MTDETDETPQPEPEPSPATPEETPTAATKAFTYDDAVAPGSSEGREGDEVSGEGSATAEAPTEATPVAPAAVAPPAAPATAAPGPADRPAGIFIPKWVALVAAAIVAALVFGGIGYAIGDASSDSGSTQNAGNAFPNGNGGGQLPGFGDSLPNGRQLPNGNSDGPTASNAGFLGVGVETSTDPKGVEITEVADNSPAAKAGLQDGDVITAIDGKDVASAQAVRSVVQAKKSGDEISVTYTRDGQSHTTKVTLTSRSQAQSS